MKFLFAIALAIIPTLSQAEFFDTEKRVLINAGEACGLQENSPVDKWDACFAIHFLLSSEGIGSIIYTAMEAGKLNSGEVTSPEMCATLKASITEINAVVDKNFEAVTGERKATSPLFAQIQAETAKFSLDVESACNSTNGLTARLQDRVVPLQEKIREMVK